MIYRCPTDVPEGEDPEVTVMGCGQTFEQDPLDHEGFADCPHCGLFFKPRPEDVVG